MEVSQLLSEEELRSLVDLANEKEPLGGPKRWELRSLWFNQKNREKWGHRLLILDHCSLFWTYTIVVILGRIRLLILVAFLGDELSILL